MPRWCEGALPGHDACSGIFLVNAGHVRDPLPQLPSLIAMTFLLNRLYRQNKDGQLHRCYPAGGTGKCRRR